MYIIVYSIYLLGLRLILKYIYSNDYYSLDSREIIRPTYPSADCKEVVRPTYPSIDHREVTRPTYPSADRSC